LPSLYTVVAEHVMVGVDAAIGPAVRLDPLGPLTRPVPRVLASAPRSLTAAPGGNLLLTYVRRRDDPALTYTLQGTPTLTPPVWNNVLAFTIDEQVTPLDAAYSRVEVTLNAPLAGPAGRAPRHAGLTERTRHVA
jgi:hypothetical protein